MAITTTTQLRQMLDEHIDGQVLTLARDTLESPEIQELFDEFLEDRALVITECHLANDGATVTGIGGSQPLKNFQITASFSIRDDGAALQLEATRLGSQPWSLMESFPALTGTTFSDLQWLGDQKFYLNSHHESDVQPRGLFFLGGVALAGNMSMITWLFGDEDRLPLAGSIVIDQGIPKADLRGSTNAPIPFAFFTDIVFACSLQCRPVVTIKDNTQHVYAFGVMELSAHIPFISQGRQRFLTVKTLWSKRSSLLIFQVDLNDTIGAAFDELKSLVNGASLESLIPSEFNIENVLTLTDVVFRIDPRHKQLLAVCLGVKSARRWPIVPGHLDIEEIGLYATFLEPFGRNTLLTIMGNVKLGNTANMLVHAAAPDFQFIGELEEDSSVDLKQIGEYFLGSMSEVPAIRVTELQFSLAPKRRSYSGTIEVALGNSGWEIPLASGSLEFKDIYLEVSREANNDTQGRIGGTLAIGGVDLYVLAEHVGSDQGWNFSGRTDVEEEINVGAFIDDLSQKFNITVPDLVSDIVVKDIEVSFHTKSRDFTFFIQGSFPVDNTSQTSLDIFVAIKILRGDNSFIRQVEGHLTLGGHRFNLNFVAELGGQTAIATYDAENADRAKISDLIDELLPDGITVPEVEISLQGSVLVLQSIQLPTGTKNRTKRILFGVNLGMRISLSNLPMVGEALPRVVIEDLRMMLASTLFDKTAIEEINTGLEGNVQLPAQAIGRGSNVSASIHFGDKTEQFAINLSGGGDARRGANLPAAASDDRQVLDSSAEGADKAKWFKVDKSLGPVQFQRIGMKYEHEKLWFLLDVSLSALGLTLSLDGLAVGSRLDRFEPSFDLRGIGIGYDNGPIEISGAFLRRHVPAKDDLPAYDEYSGAALITTETLALSAIGSYAEVNDQTSLFIYAVLDYPLGGPSFFFVTGLAAGFGINRGLSIPPIGELETFPLVTDAVNGASMPAPNQLTQKLNQLGKYIPVSIGEYFFAIGIKFNSFKLIDSFVLLTVSFGRQLEVNVVGISTLVVPTPEAGQSITPLAVVQMALKATFIPEEGFLGVQAQLTSASYILSESCRLTGGYAFYTWMSGKYAGDFVVTLGGYHPKFIAPAHFPQVPRAGFRWKVDNHLTIKGNAYYALTSHALMCGGNLECTYNKGDLKAWFRAGADFLIAWKPYHYDAHMYINIGGSYDFGFGAVSVEVGADLHIWGPEFAGTAVIDLSVTTIEASFGNSSPRLPPPIDWDTFKSSFLPTDEEVCGVSIQQGLVRTVEEETTTGQKNQRWIVNPKAFELITNSAVPSKIAFQGQGAAEEDMIEMSDAKTDFGIDPMAVAPTNVNSIQRIRILRNKEEVHGEFAFKPVLKNLPAGLWGRGQDRGPKVNGQAMIKDALTGFEIRPKASPRAGTTAQVDRSALRYETTNAPVSVEDVELPFFATQLSDEQRRVRIDDSSNNVAVKNRRQSLFNTLGFEAVVPDSVDINNFLVAPQIEALPV